MPVLPKETVGDLVNRAAGDSARPVTVKLGMTENRNLSIMADMAMSMETMMKFNIKYMFFCLAKDTADTDAPKATDSVNDISILMNASKTI